ncbi:MAG: hypothetical protein Q9218_003279 [Villophora microphyllina]
MKSPSGSMASSIAVLILVTASNFCHARPHTHGAFDHIRRFVHPLKAGYDHTHASSGSETSSIQPSFSGAAPTIQTGAQGSGKGLGEANATIAAPMLLQNIQPTPKSLALVLQEGQQILHQDIPTKSQRHGAHLSHPTKVSGHSQVAGSSSPSSVNAGQQVTKVTHVPRQVQTVSNNPNDGAYHSWVIEGSSNPTSTSAPAESSLPTSLCPGHNGTVFRSGSGITYETICATDYTDEPIRSETVNSFADCVRECDIYNYNAHKVTCVAVLFAQSHINRDPNCYLKSSILHPSAVGDSVEGAIRYSVAQSAHSPVSGTTSGSISSTSATSTSSRNTSLHPQSLMSMSTLPSSSGTVSPPGVTYGNGNSVIAPKVASTKLHGPSVNRPTTQYIQYDPADGVSLARSLLQVGVNGDLSTGYDISPQTGVLEVNLYTQNALAPLRNIPHLSRDGGRGGYLNGQHLFLFSDTGSYSGTTLAQNGNFLDFVSSSVAVDVGMNALRGDPITLQDGIGEWSDDVGRQRGFAPLTQGEEAYNIAMQGQGQRYALWIESSIIPLDAETGLIYSPIVYDDVNLVTRAAVFTYTGNTILRITAGGRGGPVAQRPVRKLFDQDEPEWGVNGGLRSWGPSGIGGTDGRVYLFAGVSGGMLMARVAADSTENRDAYQFWNGNSWSTIMPANDSKAFFMEGPIMDIDVFYSPRHMTFIAVYLTIYADSTFYYRYLNADHAIIPSYAPGGDKNLDCAELLLKYQWSDEQVLYKANPGLGGAFIYSGGVHLQYFGSDDIANGGSRLLLSWTAPTGQNPASATSEYQIVTAEVDLA